MKSVKADRITLVLNIAASIIVLIAVALLIINITIFKNAVSQYVAQGYPAADVMKQLIPSQLIPGIFQPVAVYGGIALILFGIGKIYKKSSECLSLLTKVEECDNPAEESISEENVIDTENTDDNKI